eukprot:m.134898 g.134898  ORF g.134898 m.134898 type:complete len:106 (-) comp13966_c2_seq2:339-656(-)
MIILLIIVLKYVSLTPNQWRSFKVGAQLRWYAETFPNSTNPPTKHQTFLHTIKVTSKILFPVNSLYRHSGQAADVRQNANETKKRARGPINNANLPTVIKTSKIE